MAAAVWHLVGELVEEGVEIAAGVPPDERVFDPGRSVRIAHSLGMAGTHAPIHARSDAYAHACARTHRERKERESTGREGEESRGRGAREERSMPGSGCAINRSKRKTHDEYNQTTPDFGRF